MKKLFNISLAALAAMVVGLTSCNKNPQPEVVEPMTDNGMVVISVSPENGAPTKAEGTVVSAYENAIGSLQVFVFYASDNATLGQVAGNKETDKYLTFSGNGNAQSATLTTTVGSKKVYAVANAPRLTNVTSEADLKSRVLHLGYNDLSNGKGMVMVGAYGYTSGDAEINVNSDAIEVTAYTQGSDATITTIPISLHRLAARIELSNVKVDFRGTWLENTGGTDNIAFTIKEIYLKNVPNAVYTTGQNSSLLGTASYWTNKMTPEATPVDGSGDIKRLIYSNNNYSCPVNGVNTTINEYFYSYPNTNTTDATSSTWSQRRTRLVVHAEVTGQNSLGASFNDSNKNQYYPIIIADPNNFVASGSSDPTTSATHSKIVGNHKYVINSINITMLGKPNDNNDDPIVIGKATINVSVQDWNGNTVLNYDI